VHLEATIAAGRFTGRIQPGTTRIIREGIGVCALITPWNWPMNQIACKVGPGAGGGLHDGAETLGNRAAVGGAVRRGLHEAGVPPGVFNLSTAPGPRSARVLSSHPEVDMVSFTGSTRAGTQVAQAAAPTVKRVAQELGGKSPNIILPGLRFGRGRGGGVEACMATPASPATRRPGCSCRAPAWPRRWRLRGRRRRWSRATRGPRHHAGPADQPRAVGQGPGADPGRHRRRRALVTGGPGRPEGLNRGHFVRPTVFGDVTNDMTIAREEIFGPVLAILPYDSVDEAVAMANDTPTALPPMCRGPRMARAVARRLRAGQVSLNYPDWDTFAPFGGYKQSGNGREYADWGIHDFCEVKASSATARGRSNGPIHEDF
jgi:aldehyde dehydrogenase (NAD+)